MQTRIYRPTPHNLRMLAQRLQADEIVGVPAETVYGLAGNGLSATACARIFEAKRRPAHDPLILHLHDRSQAHALCHWNEAAERLADRFWPGPLTLILPKKPIVPDLATSGLPSVALRAPAHPVFRRLLQQVELPLAAPSANPFGYISPTSANHVKTSLDGRVRYILDGGDCAFGIESTVLDIRDPQQPRILRPGVVTAAMIADCLGNDPVNVSATETNHALAPGLQDKHYSPMTPLSLFETAVPPADEKPDAVVFFHHSTPDSSQHQFSLTSSGDGKEAAHRLFRLLRQLDEQGYRRIHLQVPPTGTRFREALLDRLSRAAKK